MKTIAKVLADNLRELRKIRGMTQAELAEASDGMSVQTVQMVETCKRWPGTDTISSLAKGLCVEEEVLFASKISVVEREPSHTGLRDLFLVLARVAALDESEMTGILRSTLRDLHAALGDGTQEVSPPLKHRSQKT